VRYRTAESFRQALEDRLREENRRSGLPLDHLRKRVAFERFVARLYPPEQDLSASPFVVKGAFALVQRIQTRRTTKDLDLALLEEKTDPLDVLLDVAERDAGDFFHFQVSARTRDRPQEPGARRFAVEASLAGRRFEGFNLDVVTEPLGDESVEVLELPPRLDFAGVPGTRVRAISPPRHYADKLHAYTRPRKYRSRVKDLIDLALLTLELEGDPRAPATILAEIEKVFDLYATHELPELLPRPPGDWKASFKAMAKEAGLEPPDLDVWFDRANIFYEKLKANSAQS